MNRKTRRTLTRVATFTTGVALGLNLLSGAASAAPLTTAPAVPDVVTTQERPFEAGPPGTSTSTPADNPSDAKYECSDSHHSDTGHGANNSDGYQSTCDEADFGGNGQEFGPGFQTGKPCAGCVGNADDKNPPGQYPDGSDHNSGYECDGRDRPAENQQGNGNHGIGDENPAHTGCESTTTSPPPLCPDGSAMPATDTNDDGDITGDDCETDEPPFTCPGESTLPPMDQDGNGIVDLDDCNEAPPAPACPDGSALPMSDLDGNGVINAADCNFEDEAPFVCPDEEMPATDVDGNGVINAADCDEAPPFVVDPAVEEVKSVVEVVVTRAVVEVVETPVPVRVEIATQVLALELTPAPAPAPQAATDTEVLGVQIERGAAPLARTGVSDASAQVTAALLLLVLGLGLVRLGRRPVAA